MKRFARTMTILTVLAVFVTACGDSDDETAGGGEAAEATFETVNAGFLTVCTDAPYEPFEIINADGSLTGFDIEIAREVGRRYGLDLETTIQPFDGIWLQPDAGTCDAVVAAMTITPERQAQALFTDPYFDADQSLLVRAEDAGTLADLESLVGRKVGVQVGTTGEGYAQDNAPEGVEIVSFDEAAGMFLSLETGDIDAILQDFPVNAYRSIQDDKFLVSGRFPTGEQYGIAASLDNQELVDAINSALADMRADGKYDEIFSEYFGS